jgi:alkyl hydroperoxide reductase subunit F
MRDVLIIGGGPAGLSAGVYCARKMLDTLVISTNVGGQATWSWEVENYLGYQLITGVELVERFREHLEQFPVELAEGATVISLARGDGGFVSRTDKKDQHSARAVIVASGKVPRKLEVPGEEEYRGRGVVYCATCDAPLFRHKKVAVIGGGNSALDAALQLSSIAERVTIVTSEPNLEGDEIRRKQLLALDTVEILASARVTSIYGDNFVKGLALIHEGEERRMDVEGVFIEIGSIPSTAFLPPEVELNETGEIIIDSNNRTSLPGLFAAGDVTNVAEKQIIIAAGEGAKAALGAYSWLAESGFLASRIVNRQAKLPNSPWGGK